MADITKAYLRTKGGLGSGHHGHAGRPGKRGGSAPGKAWYGEMAQTLGMDEKGVAKIDKLLTERGIEFTEDELFINSEIILMQDYAVGFISEEKFLRDMYDIKPEILRDPSSPTYDFQPGSGGLPVQMAPENSPDEFLDGVRGGFSVIDDWEQATHKERGDVKSEIVAELAARTGLPEDDVNAVIEQWARTSNDNDMRALSLQEAAAEEFGIELSEWQENKINPYKEYNRLMKEATNLNEMGWDLRDIDFDKSEELRKQSFALSKDADAVRKAFGLDTGAGRRGLLSREDERAIIREMYTNTQEALRNSGFESGDHVRLYRGVTWDDNPGFDPMDKFVEYRGNVMESWSIDRGIAGDFASGHGLDYSAVISMDVPIENVIGTARTGFGCLTEGEFVITGTVAGSEAVLESYEISEDLPSWMQNSSGITLGDLTE